MPSPFPGMDPYLEDPVLFPGLHQSLITFIRGALNRVLPGTYVADIGERLYVVEPGRNVLPDVMVFRDTSAPPRRSGGVAVAEKAAPPWVFDIEPVEVREVFVQVVLIGRPVRVVTAIEVLSPTNKAPGTTGRERYLTKQAEVLESGTHLVEIDLLRRGEHTVATPLETLLSAGRWDYLVSRHRAGTGRFEVWPILLRDRLPSIRIPLAGDDPDVIVDLQPLFDRCYDEGPYSRWLDYTQEPAVPLSPDDAVWANALLHEKGLRK